MCSEIPLEAAAGDRGTADVHVRWGTPRIVPDAAPPGRQLARLDNQLGSYTVAKAANGYCFRFHSLCDFAIALDLREVRVDLDLRADPGIVPILLTGNVLALLLAVRLQGVLHASAVEIDESALAFVGGSGMGKSTIAALCCLVGARLVADDMLRVEANDGESWCFQGGARVRLRPAASDLARFSPAEAVEHTADGRTSVLVDAASKLRLRLGGLAVLRPSRDGRRLRVERLRARDALIELLRCPRIASWCTPEPHRIQLDVLHRLVQLTPVYMASVPWGDASRPAVAADLLRLLRS